jgi:SAM-dependent methyltransferase
VRLFRQSGLDRGFVVEFGCGGGTVARHLTDHGYSVLGIDQSPAMIRLARRNAPRARFKVGSLATATLPRCDAIVALGEVVSYNSKQEDLLRFFRRAGTVLRPGGLLVFDFIESAEGRTFKAKSRAGEDWAIVIRATAKGRVLTRHITTFRKIGRHYRRSREIHHVRLYNRSEIATALRGAGFTVTLRRSIGRVRLIRGDLLAIATAAQALY